MISIFPADKVARFNLLCVEPWSDNLIIGHNFRSNKMVGNRIVGLRPAFWSIGISEIFVFAVDMHWRQIWDILLLHNCDSSKYAINLMSELKNK